MSFQELKASMTKEAGHPELYRDLPTRRTQMILKILEVIEILIRAWQLRYTTVIRAGKNMWEHHDK